MTLIPSQKKHEEVNFPYDLIKQARLVFDKPQSMHMTQIFLHVLFFNLQIVAEYR